MRLAVNLQASSCFAQSPQRGIQDLPSINFVGYDIEPVSYVAQEIDEAQLLGYYLEAASQEDFDKAAKVPGAGPVTPLQTPGGGYAIQHVTLCC